MSASGRAWAYLGPDKDLASAKLFPEKWRAQAAAGLDACTDTDRIIPVEIATIPNTGGGR